MLEIWSKAVNAYILKNSSNDNYVFYPNMISTKIVIRNFPKKLRKMSINFVDLIVGQVHVDLQQELWAAIDEEIDVKNCEIFSYNPDLSGG